MIVVAPDKFKGTLSGGEVAAVIAHSIRDALPDEIVVELPLADGGEGSVDLALRAGFEKVRVQVTGPLGNPVQAAYAWGEGTAVIEMAAAAGLALLPDGPNEQTAMIASTYGVGQLLDHALRREPERVVLGVGGSATTDGGAGLAAALGARIVTESGSGLRPGAAGLGAVVEVGLTALVDRLASAEVVIACDVDNPLLGPDGAAAVFGPQKGADSVAVQVMQHHLAHWNAKIVAATGRDVADLEGSGAAGGIGVPLLATRTARVTSGADVMMELAGFGELIEEASMVIVGEGSLDAQSLRGKGPIAVARRARQAGATVVAVVGTNQLSAAELADSPIDRVYALTDVEPDVDVCMTDSHAVLETLAAQLAATEAAATRIP